MDHAKMLAAVQAYFDRFNTQDPDGIADLYADDAVVVDPYPTAPKEGREAILAFYTAAVKSNSTLVQEGTTRISGNRAAFAFTVHVGGLSDESKVTDVELPMGKMQIDVIDIFEFNEDGKVTSMTAHWDPAVNLRQV